MSPQPVLPAGTVVADRFRVVELIGQGKRGATYIVEPTGGGDPSAMTVLDPKVIAGATRRARFTDEVRVAQKISSASVARTVDTGIDVATGRPWFVMELLAGETLPVLVARGGGKMLRDFRRLIMGTLDAVAAAHAVSIVHYDLVPENVHIVPSPRPGDAPIAKVRGFGIGRFVAEQVASVGDPLDGPAWLSPEQLEGEMELTPQANVWSLGLFAFYLLVGKPYWKGPADDAKSVLDEIREVGLPPASKRALQAFAVLLPPWFDEWFAKCVAKDSKERYADAREARATLLVLFRDRGVPRPTPPPPAAAKAPSRPPPPVPRHSPPPPPHPAPAEAVAPSALALTPVAALEEDVSAILDSLSPPKGKEGPLPLPELPPPPKLPRLPPPAPVSEPIASFAPALTPVAPPTAEVPTELPRLALPDLPVIEAGAGREPASKLPYLLLAGVLVVLGGGALLFAQSRSGDRHAEHDTTAASAAGMVVSPPGAESGSAQPPASMTAPAAGGDQVAAGDAAAAPAEGAGAGVVPEETAVADAAPNPDDPSSDEGPAGTAPYDLAAAIRALNRVYYGDCHVTKPGKLVVTHAPSGQVHGVKVTEGNYDDTTTTCLVARFRSARIPAFRGAPQSVRASLLPTP